MMFFAAVGAIVCFAAAAWLVGVVMSVVFRSNGDRRSDCGFCDWSSESTTLLGEVRTDLAWRHHFRSKHRRERDEWYADKKTGGIKFAADEQWRRKRERREEAR